MKRIAIVTCWVVIAANLFGTLQLTQYNAVSFATILPMLLFGLTLVVHYTSHVHTAAVWIALILNVLWGAFGVVAVIFLLTQKAPNFGFTAFIGAFTLVPAIPNATVLHSRLNQRQPAHAS